MRLYAFSSLKVPAFGSIRPGPAAASRVYELPLADTGQLVYPLADERHWDDPRQASGRMFWFMWKKFVGSYLALIC